MSGNSVRLPSTKPSILCPQIDQPVFRSLPDGPAMDAAVEAYTSSAAQLIVRAQALEQVYQRMWQQEDVDARIYLYLRALDLICKFTGANEPLVTPVSPVSEGFVASELPVCEKDDHRNLTIEIYPLDIKYELRPAIAQLRLPLPIQQFLSSPTVSLDLGSGQPAQATSELLGFEDNPFGSFSSVQVEVSQDDPCMQLCCIELARAHEDRYLHTNKIDDIELQLCFSTYALASLPGQPSHQGPALLSIGVALRLRYSRLEDLADLECSLAALRQALYLSDESGADPAPFLQELGICLHRRYQRLGSLDELSESITLQQEALDLMPVQSLNRPLAVLELAWSYADRHTRLGGKEDAEEALRLREEALQLCPAGHRDRHRALQSLGNSHFIMFQKTGKLDDLHQVIQVFREGLEICPPNLASQRAAFLTSLCNQLRIRFVERGDEQDLNEAVRMGREALQILPNSGAALTNLGNALYSRFRQRGDIRDLEECIRMHRGTLQICRPGHPRRDLVANNLAKMLMLRCEQSFDFDGLGEAIALLREASELRQHGNPEWGPTMFNLAEALKMRYMQTATLSDLQEAMELHADWLARHTEVDRAWKGFLFLDAIAELRRLRFERLGDIQDLNEAIDIQEKACRIRSEEHSERHLALGCLAIAYRMRAELLNTEEDAQRAMVLQREAAGRISLGHRDRAHILLGLSRSYLVKASDEYSPNTGLDLYCDAITDVHCAAQVRLSEGLVVLDVLQQIVHNMSMDDEAQSKLLHAYRVTVHLLPQVAYFGLDAYSRLKVLAKAPRLAASAAVQAMRMSKPELAVEIMEEGRAVFWAQYLRLRSSYDQLPAELAESLTRTSRLLGSGGVQKSAPVRTDNLALSVFEEQLVQRRRLSEEFVALIEQARSLPGFGRFMLNDVFSTLSLAARTAPVLILLATPQFCGALLIRSPSAGAEQLRFDPEMETKHLFKLSGMLHNANRSTRGVVNGRALKMHTAGADKSKTVLEEMWHKVMKDIIPILGWKKEEGRRRPRLIICPTGPFTHLPVHAAGAGNESCSDYFVPSYTPTLGALLAGRQCHKVIRRSDARVLLAAVPRPFKWARLPHAVEEIALIKSVVPAKQITSVPLFPSISKAESGSASSADVLKALPGATILHLACHGHHDAMNALNSGFVMRDKMLTVAELMELSLPDSFLAFLSACETAKTAEGQPDQAIHLAATMLFAGFKSVIGTMWSMDDVDGPAVAKRVYEEVFGGESEYFDPNDVPYALDAAVGEMRKQNLHPSRWAPYVHLGI